MRQLNIPSLTIGCLATLLVMSLMSSKPQMSGNLQITGHPVGIAVYNSQDHSLYVYSNGLSGLPEKPTRSYVISEDGSSMRK